MKRNIIKKSFILYLLASLLLTFGGFKISYAISNENQILSTDSTEISLGDSFVLNLDLSKISSEKFKIELSSDCNLENPDVEIEDEDVIETTSEDSIFTITASKSELNLSALQINYIVPIDATFTNFEINCKVFSLDNEEESELYSESLNFTIVEKSEKENNQPNNQMPTDNQTSTNKDNNFSGIIQQNGNMQNSSENMTKTSTNLMSGSSMQSQSSNMQEVTYNGSDNTYLSALSVDSYDLTTTFAKTNTSYFVNLPSGTTSITVNATAEESSSSICIYGNDALTSGINKILITVTSESGSVKTYRLYATVNN